MLIYSIDYACVFSGILYNGLNGDKDTPEFQFNFIGDSPMKPLSFNVIYNTLTPESAEYGEQEETGFEHIDYLCDNFSDVVSLVERYGYGGVPEIDYMDGSETRYDLYANNGRADRYMRLAYRYSANGHK